MLNAAPVMMPPSPYKNVELRNVRIQDAGSPVVKLKIETYYPKGNKSPQPQFVIPQITYNAQGVPSKPGAIKVTNDYVKAVITGAVTATCTGNYKTRGYMDEGGGMMWYATLRGTETNVRAGTAYINAFDEKGNLISSTTVTVNTKGVSE